MKPSGSFVHGLGNLYANGRRRNKAGEKEEMGWGKIGLDKRKRTV
jgi:hypothetical protein